MIDLGFGLDVSCYVNGDLDATFAPMTGARVVAEAVARRLETPRGSLADDPDFGFDVISLLNDGASPTRLALSAAAIAAEAEKDERVLSADTTVVFDAGARTLRIRIALVTSAGPFPLVLDVSAAGLALANGT